MASALALAACGSAAPPTSRPASTAAPAGTSAARRVATVDADVTSQMVRAAAGRSSTDHQAVFTLTARTAAGTPAAGAPVTFWVGPMVPLSGTPPTHWYRSGTSAAKPYIASYTKATNSSGQAKLVLLGQPAKSMEMVAAKVGGLDSFDSGAGRGVGLLDAWWTTASTSPTAPVGESVRVTPFLTAPGPGRTVTLQVQVRGAGGPVDRARVQVISKALVNTGTPSFPAGSAMSGSGMSGSGMSGSAMSGSGSAMSGGSSRTLVTGATGTVDYQTTAPESGAARAVRVVVTLPSSGRRAAGGMAAEIVG